MSTKPASIGTMNAGRWYGVALRVGDRAVSILNAAPSADVVNHSWTLITDVVLSRTAEVAAASPGANRRWWGSSSREAAVVRPRRAAGWTHRSRSGPDRSCGGARRGGVRAFCRTQSPSGIVASSNHRRIEIEPTIVSELGHSGRRDQLRHRKPVTHALRRHVLATAEVGGTESSLEANTVGVDSDHRQTRHNVTNLGTRSLRSNRLPVFWTPMRRGS